MDRNRTNLFKSNKSECSRSAERTETKEEFWAIPWRENICKTNVFVGWIGTNTLFATSGFCLSSSEVVFSISEVVEFNSEVKFPRSYCFLSRARTRASLHVSRVFCLHCLHLERQTVENKYVMNEGEAGEGGEGWDTSCLHPQLAVALRLRSSGEGGEGKMHTLL